MSALSAPRAVASVGRAAAVQAVPKAAQTPAAEAPVALVTGATSDGIGIKVMEGLLQKGFDIIAIARNPVRAARLEVLAATYPHRQVKIYYADLSLVRDIRTVAEEIKAKHPRIDRMVNNLGVMLEEKKTTDEGHDTSEMINAVAPWMLARLLMPTMQQSSDARVVQLNSDGHANFDNKHAPAAFQAYGADKLTALLLNYELVRRLERESISVNVNSVHPGHVRSELGRHMHKFGPAWQRPMWVAGRWFHNNVKSISPQEAANPIIALAADDAHKDETGAYYAMSTTANPARRFWSPECISVKQPSSAASRDAAAAAACWDKFSDLVGLPRDAV